MVRGLLIQHVRKLVSIQLGDSKIRKFIPDGLFKRLKVLKYNLWLMNATLTRNRNFNLGQLVHFFRQDRKCILFYPDIPWETSCISLYCLERGYRITNNISGRYDAAIKWKDATFYQPDEKLQRLAEIRPVINYHCNDISKAHVDAIFGEVFGYSTIVDPRVYRGTCVEKSEMNARHDGRLVNCPIQNPREGMFYQILIDSRVDDDHVMDIRVPVYRDCLPPKIYAWVKPVDARFDVDVGERLYLDVDELFTPEEQRNIVRFCRRLGLDFGELDILRNRGDGRLYIIDANNTPDYGEIDFENQREDIRVEAMIFEKVFLGL